MEQKSTVAVDPSTSNSGSTSGSNGRRDTSVIKYLVAIFACLIIIFGLVFYVADRRAEKDADIRQAAQIAQVQARIAQDQAVAACESRNTSRATTRNYELYFIYLLTRDAPVDAVDDRIALLRTYLNTAYDPVICEWGHPDFNVDTTPPPPLPPEADVVLE